jgi:CheY-like chemotaxis protein
MQEIYLQSLWNSEREGESAGTGISITHFPFVIGRHGACDHFVSNPWVSRRHCSFFLRDDKVWLVDLGSKHGTYLNGKPVRDAQAIRHGDQVIVAHLPFQVRLPALPGAPPVKPGGAARAAGPNGQTHNVLVVEDNVDAAETLALLLKGWGHEVHVALDGAEAVQAAQAHQPDTVLLDLRLPRMDGYQVAQQLRAQAATEKALVVALTGYEPDKGWRRPEEAGIDRLLTKPVDPKALQEVLSQSR